MIVLFTLLTVWVVAGRFLFTFSQSDTSAVAEFKKDSLTLHTQTICLEGNSLHFAQTGSPQKPTLFFVHGSPGSWTAFKDYLRDTFLLRQYRLVSVDRPGFGTSDFGDPQKLNVQVALLLRLIDSLDNGQPFYPVGHSSGGPLVLALAAKAPAKIAAVVMLAGSVDPDAETPEYWRRIFFRNPLQYLLPGAFRPSNEELIYLKTDLKAMPGVLEKVYCPVVIVHGTKDGFVPYGNALWAKEKLKNAASVLTVPFENAGHFIPWTHHTEIRNLLLNLPVPSLP